MFSVKTENLLLNYFVVLFTIGLLFVYHLTLPFLILFILFLLSGILLFFDRYFSFKATFLLGILLSILILYFTQDLNVVIFLILFIALSQISVLLSYLLLFISLNLYFEFLEIVLIFSIFVLTVIFLFFFGLGNLQKEMRRKIFSSEFKHRCFVHDISNICSIIFLKNKDENLEPILEKMRINLNPKNSKAQSSVGGLLRMTIYFLSYDYNLKVKNNFFIHGENLSWVCLFYNLLENYVRKGSTIVVEKDYILFVLKDGNSKELEIFLKKQFIKESIKIEKNILKFNYGM